MSWEYTAVLENKELLKKGWMYGEKESRKGFPQWLKLVQRKQKIK